ncbi:helix-turn-helix domain-containing protein [Amycolatopsis cihanbeyliensis]|uniref:Helix-turn-helix domain-containing protein n=1 Tax=Amycolatopsis cihanbeyliensis TaxID=1128664 RepID=A0A542DKP6_AMYCI|nr:helix-turn-helix domain-containing protein [Amycolatopsis cihanbeyliensis]TQJ03666.1 hypothetical protein FB471_3430 [Amycolatopsis cihanbeyliensis]
MEPPKIEILTGVPEKGVRLTGPARAKLADDMRKVYERGATVREIATAMGRSYGSVHRLLTEAGTVFRAKTGKPPAPPG